MHFVQKHKNLYLSRYILNFTFTLLLPLISFNNFIYFYILFICQELPLPEHQEYVDQMSLLQKKLVHLEETLKIEEQEGLLKEKINFHQSNSVKEAQLIARKKIENAANQKQLQEEESARRAIIQNMVNETDKTLSPIKDVLVHFEGINLYRTQY